MDDRIIQFRVGVVVIAAFLIGGTLALWFGDGMRQSYALYIQYPSAPGVAVDTPVRKNGIRIGRVTNVELKDECVLLTLNIDEGRILRTNEKPRLGTASLLGDSVIEFVLCDPKEVTQEVRIIQAGETLAGESASGGPMAVLQMVADMGDDIEAALGAVESAGTKIARMSDSLNAILGENNGQLTSVVAKTDQALGSFNQVMTHVNDVLGDAQTKAQIKQTLVNLPVVLNDARQTLADARTTFAGFARVGQRAENNLANLEGLTKPLGESGHELVNALQRSVSNVEELATQLTVFSEALNNSNGSLGQLVHNRELFDRLNRAAENIELASGKLKPIMNDARVLTDKLARDPSQLGIRGAISRNPSAGLKYPAIGNGSVQR